MKKLVALTAIAAALSIATDAAAFKSGWNVGANLAYAKSLPSKK